MVTGDKPDEQVDWSEVVGGRPTCSVEVCELAAVSRVVVEDDRVDFYCARHLAGVSITIALGAVLGIPTPLAIVAAQEMLGDVEVVNLV